MPGALAPAQRQKTLGHESAVETDERYDIGDGAECDVVKQRQQVGLGALFLQKPRERSSRLTATTVMKVKPTAARWPRPERSSRRLGLTMANAGGRASSA